MTDRRKRVASGVAALCAAALGGSLLVASPSQAQPDIGDVRAKVEQLYHEAEQASERYNLAHEQLAEAKTRLAALRADLAREQTRYDAVRRQLAASLVAEYQGQGLSAAGQAVLSDDPDAFLADLTTLMAFHQRQGDAVHAYTVEAKRLELRKAAAERELAQIAATEKRLAADKAEIDKKAAEAKALLGRMEDAARERMLAASRSTERPPLSSVPASGRARAVVAFALAQVGDAYVYGAAGPDAWDCSGLTMVAWAQAGVSLPHSSSAQYGYGAHVSASQLQPGDLVFYYSPISHVGIYIGNGKIVHAAHPGAGVEVASLYSMPFSGAVRPG